MKFTGCRRLLDRISITPPAEAYMNESLEIRRAEEADMPRINDLLEQVCLVHHLGRPDLFKRGAKKYSDEELRELIHDDSRPIFVALLPDARLCGYAFCQLICHEHDNILTPIRTLYIDDLCVDENLRGHHVGSSLYGYVKDFAKKIGCYNLTLNVWSRNTSAIKFYEAQGLTSQKTTLETIL